MIWNQTQSSNKNNKGGFTGVYPGWTEGTPVEGFRASSGRKESVQHNLKLYALVFS